MIKILFVCHGNICRSPLAEFVLRDMASKAGKEHLLEIASGAVSREEEGNPIYPPARRLLEAQGIHCSAKRARVITRQDCAYYDRIYYMDSANLRRLKMMFPDYDGFLPFLDRDVADPYYYGNFEKTWEDIQEGCSRILKECTQ